MPGLKVIPFSLCFIFIVQFSFSQGGLDHIKQQGYLKRYSGFDCDSIPDEYHSTLTDKICANLRLQKSDSTLIVYYDSLQQVLKDFGGEDLVAQFDTLQKDWRGFRDAHCNIIWNQYEGCGGCNLRAAHYMREMSLLTDQRVEAIKKLLVFYRRERY